MSLRDFGQVKYIPVLAISIAEMTALQHLPDQNKDSILPLFRLKRWCVSATLSKTEQRIQRSYGNRPFIGDLAEATPINGARQAVHNELDALRDPQNGYANWCAYASLHGSMIPTIQLGNLSQVPAQVKRLEVLGRGLAVYLGPNMHSQIANISAFLANHVSNQADLLFIIDLGPVNKTILLAQAATTSLVRSAISAIPNMSVAISASSFPKDFVGLTSQDIYERQHFLGVANQISSKLIYSDHGSARTGIQARGGGTPAPRIDIPEQQKWDFFRSNGGTGSTGRQYQQQAVNALAAHPSVPAGVWGFDQVRRTASGTGSVISSPASSTSARINMHLFRQS